MPEPPAQPPSTLPLAELLALLRERKLPIGLREHLMVGKLLSRWNDPDPMALRGALAALLARNPNEVAEVHRAFDELYGEPAAPAPTPSAAPEKRPAWRWVAAVALLLVLGLVAATLLWPREPPPPQPLASAAARAAQPLPPAIRDSFRVPDRRRALLGAAGLAGGLLFAAWWRRLRHASVRAARRHWRERVDEMPGPQGYEIALSDLPPPLPTPVLDDAATLLGRRTPASPRRGELDVDRTLERTLRAGLAPDPAFRVRAAAPPLLILEDIGAEMLPWEERVESLLRALAARGVAFDRWRFHADASQVFRAPGNPEISLQQLARSTGDRGLLVISAGEGVQEGREGRTAAWVERLAAWPRRSWLHPSADPASWRPALRRVPAAVWPLSADGLLGAARHLGHGRPGPAARGTARAEADRPVTPVDIDRLRALLAMAPRRDPELLERLRARFCPHVPAAALSQALDAPPPVSPVCLGPDPAEVHAFLADLLAGSEPGRETAAHERWRLDRALQELRVPSRAERAIADLSALARGPLAHLVEDAVGDLTAASAEPPPPATLLRDLRRRVLAPIRRRAAASPLGGWRAVPGPGRAALAAGLVLLPLAAFILPSLSRTFTQDKPARQQERYSLKVSDGGPGHLRIAAEVPARWAAVPKVAVVYGTGREDTLPDWRGPLADALRGHWVYLRDAKPDSQGVLGISPPVPLPAFQPEQPQQRPPTPSKLAPVDSSGAETREAPTRHTTQGSENDGSCPSDFVFPAYNPRGCDSNCAPFDLVCLQRKSECERLKEQERYIYETEKLQAQAAFSAEKSACEARQRNSPEQTSADSPQDLSRQSEIVLLERHSEPTEVRWNCTETKVATAVYSLAENEVYVTARIELDPLDSHLYRAQPQEPTYDWKLRQVSGTVTFEKNPPADGECLVNVSLAVTIRLISRSRTPS